MGFRRLVPVLLLAGWVCVGCGKRVDNASYARSIQELTSATPSWVDRSAAGRRLWKIEQAFYKSRQHMPAWVDGVETTPHWKDLIQQLKYSSAHGLDPARYPVEEFESLREQSQTKLHGTQFPVERVPELDVKMTYAYLKYAADLLGWTRSPREVHPNWLTDSKKEDLSARLADAIANNRVRASLEDLAPTHPQYKGLQAALAVERANPTGRRRDPDEPGALAVGAAQPRRSLHPGQRAGLRSSGDGARSARAIDARHRRRSRPSDAALQRRDDLHRV